MVVNVVDPLQNCLTRVPVLALSGRSLTTDRTTIQTRRLIDTKGVGATRLARASPSLSYSSRRSVSSTSVLLLHVNHARFVRPSRPSCPFAFVRFVCLRPPVHPPRSTHHSPPPPTYFSIHPPTHPDTTPPSLPPTTRPPTHSPTLAIRPTTPNPPSHPPTHSYRLPSLPALPPARSLTLHFNELSFIHSHTRPLPIRGITIIHS